MHAGLITSHDLQVCKGECVFGLRLEGVALGKALECRSRERRTSRISAGMLQQGQQEQCRFEAVGASTVFVASQCARSWEDDAAMCQRAFFQ